MSSHRRRISKKFFVIAGITTALLSGGTAVAVAQVNEATKVKAYGFCVNKVDGTVRALERNNLAKSQYGKCRSNEVKVLVKEGTWLPTPVAVPVAKFTTKRGTEVETCTLTVPVVAVPEYVCTK